MGFADHGSRRAGWGAALLGLLLATGARAELTLHPSLRLTAEERYDDDRLLLADGVGLGQLMTKVTPEAGLTLRDPTLELDARYAPSLLMRHGSGTSGIDHRGLIAMDKRLSRRLNLEGRVQLWRVEDPTSLPRLGMARTLSPMLYATAQARTRYALTRRWSAEAEYNFEAARILEDGNPFGFVHQPEVGTWYAASRRTGLGLTYRFQAFLFDERLAYSHSPNLGYRYRLSRQVTFAAAAGPIFYTEPTARGGSGVLPRVALELNGDGQTFDWTMVVGHDLVGANGFDTALWADYVSAIGQWALNTDVNFYAVASGFRNGRAPNEALLSFNEGGAATGYALGGGVEWELNRSLRFQASLDRIAQVGVGGTAGDLARNIASIRMVFTAVAPNERRPGR